MPLVLTAVMKQDEETVAMANTLKITSARFRIILLIFLQCRQKQHIGNVITYCVITLIPPSQPPPPPHPPAISVGFCFPRQSRHLSGLSPSALLKVSLSHPRSFHLARHDSGASVPAFPGSVVSQGPMGSEWEGD